MRGLGRGDPGPGPAGVGEPEEEITVTVDPAAPGLPTIDSFSATPTTITAGETAILSWTTTDASGVSINGGPSLSADGSSSVSPTTRSA